MYSSSQMEEEALAYWYFFYRRGGGLFLEMGGLDGTLYSNTLFFEKMLGWKGVLIEAKTDFYRRLRVSRKGQVRVIFFPHFLEHRALKQQRQRFAASCTSSYGHDL
jgi:hypothetical protein